MGSVTQDLATVESDDDQGGPLEMTAPQGVGILALASMSDQEFSQRLAALKKAQQRIAQIKRDLMADGVHFGVIPGTGDKPTLLKPGAEVLCSIYGMRPDFPAPLIEYGDGVTCPAVRVVVRCELHMGNLSGPVVAVGYGSSNSWERKHRYRRAERACPKCGTVGSVIKGKAEYGGGWLCWQKKGGCGAKFAIGDPEITQQAVDDVQNPDQHDLENTLIKMAEKRAQVDATLRGTASSDLFTQDVEDMVHAPETAPAREPGVDDDPEWVSGGTPEAQAAKPVEAPATPAPSGPTAPCPQCGKAARPSKFPKAGKTHYCGLCKISFGGAK